VVGRLYAPAMPSMPIPARLAVTVVAGGLLLAPLTACNSDTVSCSGSSCSVTLSGDGATAEVLNQKIAFGGVQDGRATVRVGGEEVSCAQGDKVGAGPLALECTEVTGDSVKLTASLG